MPKLQHHRMSSAFTSASLRSDMVAMGHFIGFDHFHMSQPTFPPHPHAGFSAITWMVPWSAGGFVNRDSHGDRSLIGPGSLHWTMAGAGMMHEEIPEVPGTDCEGLQIFVKLPEDLELIDGRAYHLDPAELPIADLGGGKAKILVGALGALASPIPSHARTTMLHVELDGVVSLEVPGGVDAFAVVLRGLAIINGSNTATDEAQPLPAHSTATLTGHDASVLVAWSEPMARTPTFGGPFCMFSRERLIQAQQRYQQGDMGRLSPSNVRWHR